MCALVWILSFKFKKLNLWEFNLGYYFQNHRLICCHFILVDEVNYQSRTRQYCNPRFATNECFERVLHNIMRHKGISQEGLVVVFL